MMQFTGVVRESPAQCNIHHHPVIILRHASTVPFIYLFTVTGIPMIYQ